MAIKNYETNSDILNEKEDDFDPSQYAAGSVDAMGAYYTYLANSLTRIDMALRETTKDEKLKKLLESDNRTTAYDLLMDRPYYMKEIKNAIDNSSIVKSWDEENLLSLYMDRIADMINELKHHFPEAYIKLVNRVNPYEASAYYDLEHYKSVSREYDDDVQFYKSK